MEKCKFCQAELEDGVTLCPACGKDNAEPEAAPAVEETPASAPVVEDIPETTPVMEQEPEELPAEEIPETMGENEASEAAEEGAAETAETEEKAGSEEAASAEIKPGLQATPGKIALAVAAVVVLLAVLIALIVTGMKTKAPEPEAPANETVAYTVPADGEKGTLTEKGTYTVTDEKAAADADQVVATMNGTEMTNADLQAYYWIEVRSFLNNYGAYAQYFGLDYTRALDTQVSMDSPNMTWQHYFLQCAFNNWKQIQSLKMMAIEKGIDISDEDKAFLETVGTTMEQTAAQYGMTLDQYMLAYIGPGADLEDFIKFQSDYCHGLAYYNNQLESFVPTMEDLDAYYAANEGKYAEAGLTKEAKLVDVRHILLEPTSSAGDGTFSEADWEACRAEAQALLDGWQAGDATEDSFAALAGEKTADPGSKETGGLYKEVYTGQMVQPFNDWCFDEGRKTGDTALVKTDYGYHVMYFVKGYDGIHPMWKQSVEEDWINGKIDAMFEEAMNRYPMEIDYSKISLGYVNLAG